MNSLVFLLRPRVKVYLQLSAKDAKLEKYKYWICGGVIVTEYYVISSAACVEDAEHFYIVAGTRVHVDGSNYTADLCASKNRRKVIWKCVPKHYDYDPGNASAWLTNDLAIIKVYHKFMFNVTEEGCEYPAEAIKYNVHDSELEAPGTPGTILGWGSVKYFRPLFAKPPSDDNNSDNNSGNNSGNDSGNGSKNGTRRFDYEEDGFDEHNIDFGGDKADNNSTNVTNGTDNGTDNGSDNGTTAGPVIRDEDQSVMMLQFADVVLTSKDHCVMEWPKEYESIIRKYMLCTNDTIGIVTVNPDETSTITSITPNTTTTKSRRTKPITTSKSPDCKDDLAQCQEIDFENLKNQRDEEEEEAKRTFAIDNGRQHRLLGNFRPKKRQNTERSHETTHRTQETTTHRNHKTTTLRNHRVVHGRGGRRNQFQSTQLPQNTWVIDPDPTNESTANTTTASTTTTPPPPGGTCENDHGGPLTIMAKGQPMLLGIISACKINKHNNECRGPFLYTSVYANRELIECIINGDVKPMCDKMLRNKINNNNWYVKWTKADE